MQQRSRSEYTMLNMAFGLGGYVVTFVLSLICRMVFTRVFSAEYLGINGLFSNILNMLSLAELGIGSAIVYALYAPIAKKDNKKIATLVNFYGKCYRIIAFVVLGVGLALLPFLDLIIKEKPNISENYYVIFLIMLFNSVSGYFFAYRTSVLVVAQKNYLLTLISNIVNVFQSIVQIAVMLLLKNYIIYMLIISACGFVTNIISSEIAKREYPCIREKHPAPLEKEEKRSIIKNVYGLTVNKIGSLLVNSTDNIITTYFSGLIVTGLASNYTLISTSINSLLSIIFNSVNASVGNHNVLEDKEKRIALFKSINLANFWAYGWLAITFFVVSGDIVLIMFGEDYILPMQIPLIIAINFYIVGMQNAVWTHMNVQGLFRHGHYMNIVTAALNVVLSIILGTYLGLFGILLATAIARLLTNVWYSPYALFKYGFKVSSKDYFVTYIKYTIIFVALGSVSWFLCSFVDFSSIILSVVIKFLICSGIFNLIFFLLFGKTQEIATLKTFIESAINKIKTLVNKLLKPRG